MAKGNISVGYLCTANVLGKSDTWRWDRPNATCRTSLDTLFIVLNLPFSVLLMITKDGIFPIKLQLGEGIFQTE